MKREAGLMPECYTRGKNRRRMKHFSLIALVAVSSLALSVLLLPAPASAQTNPNPIWNGPNPVTCNQQGQICGLCDAVKVTSNVITFLATDIAIPIVVLAIIYGGFLMLTAAGSDERFNSGKKALTSAIIGLVIVVASWSIVNTVLSFLSGNPTLPWNQIDCTSNTITVPYTPPAGAGGGTGGGTGGGGAGPLTDAGARSQLLAAGIQVVSSGNCSDPTNPNCTSLQGLQPATLQGALDLKQACGCNVTITGGTEVGHAAGDLSHANGYKLDFQPNAQLDSYVQSLSPLPVRSDGAAQFQGPNGTIFARESDHWDVTFGG